ncbi:YobA family protein [Lederbergia graminis]|uniref:YobA family protein n=1 Tax=Lederbergia graminis TaxID=735518 RepID=A0ABW0LL94_9BACI
MRKIYTHIILFFLVIILAACGQANADGNTDEKGKPDIIGYVMDQNDSRILVVSAEAQDFSANDGLSEYYDAISLSNAPENVKIGQMVKVWIDGPVADSYPMQGKISKLEVVESSKPDGAKMTEEQALRKIIKAQPTKQMAVRNIYFDNTKNIWKVEFKELPDGDVITIEIKD